MASNEPLLQTSTALSPTVTALVRLPPSPLDVITPSALHQQVTQDFDRLGIEKAKLRAERLDLEQQRTVINHQVAFAIKQVHRLEQEATRAVNLTNQANATLRAAAIMRQEAELVLEQVAKERKEMDMMRFGKSITVGTAPLTTSEAKQHAQCLSTVMMASRNKPDLDKELPALPKRIRFGALPAGRRGSKLPACKSPAPKRKHEEMASVPPPPGFKTRPSFEQRMANLAACHSALHQAQPILAAPSFTAPKITFPLSQDALHVKPAFRKRIHRRSPVRMLKPPPKFNPRPKKDDKLTFREHLAFKGIKAPEGTCLGLSPSSRGLPEPASPAWVVDEFNIIPSSAETEDEDDAAKSPTLTRAHRVQTGQLRKRPQAPYVSTKRHSTIYLRPGIVPSPTPSEAGNISAHKLERINTAGTTQPTQMAAHSRFRWTETFRMPGFKNHRTRSPYPIPPMVDSVGRQKAKLTRQPSSRAPPYTPPDQLIPSDIDPESDGDADDELDDGMSDLDISSPGVRGGRNEAKIGTRFTPYENQDWLSDLRKRGIIPRRMSGVDEVSSSSDGSAKKRHLRKISGYSDKTIVPTYSQIKVVPHKCDDVFSGNSSAQLPVISPGAYDSDTSSFGAGSSLMSDEVRASTKRWAGCVPASKRLPMPKSYTPPSPPE